MIDERMEEQASLYVLGVLTPEETQAFETAMRRDAELQQLVAKLRASRDALAGSLPQVTPPPALKQKILAQIEAQEKVIPILSGTERSGGGAVWFPWALAACLAIVCALSLSRQATLNSQNGEQAKQLGEQTKQLADLNQMVNSLHNETQDLKQAVATLQETNRLASIRIAMLSSMLADSPKAVAVSLWDNQQQRGVFVVQNLKPLPVDRDYQLWVMDPKYPTPVSAGVFQVDAQGNMRVQFKADKLIESASKFAVTQEPKGGLPTPTRKNLVLIGS
jgi:anti-sigma-K factor RskA